ncbi:MAG: thioredoxin domain-containing protein [Syntrophothermus sp.]|uniref:thioredoxin domain-containing protein n=1 Tax=Syntrophothermus sp. TaxID=2736299 RepID=UPI00257EFB49|nr:thioredoxin domain-containing protein [Syntrophothermus sp.]NSW82595.1 thioredoxin domain-containing protein [Syntrophothermus sp.]
MEKLNRLIREKSPYLLQHATNPVNWYPWGEEAFAKARKEDKPVFLSIGYSTCHWCHVMEKESFQDEEVARLLNEHYVAIKVDREERPDVDQIYMAACQAMTGQGGWPLTIILTPDKRPFFAGTYFPKRGRWGRPGLMDILEEVAKVWKSKREQIEEAGRRLVGYLEQVSRSREGELDERVLERAYQEFAGRFDGEYGGFSPAPKFPTPHNLLFLLRFWKRTGRRRALEMAEKTLDSMARGGIYDHIGFGFHRYSTDREWLVPHFEKMLYDNALLAYTYLEAYQATGRKEYTRVAEEIFAYVRRNMTSPEGGFYSAEDADSEGVEGKFYVWTPDEIKRVLGSDDGEFFCRVYDITPQGNFEGKSIPNLIHTRIEKVADDRRYGPKELEEVLGDFRQKLFQEREKRTHPLKDDKILTSWNGLMIAALARGARVLQNDGLLDMAQKAADFITSKLVRGDGRLLGRYRDGEAAIPGYLDDYAFFVWGLLELYEASFEVRYFRRALQLSRQMLELFWDDHGGGLYFYGADAEELITRPKEIYDGAVPSGNSVAAYILLKLARLTEDESLEEKGREIFSAFAGEVANQPSAYSFLMVALLFVQGPVTKIVIAGSPQAQETREMIRMVNACYLPSAVVMLNVTGEEGRGIRELTPHLEKMAPLPGTKATAYICENSSCRAPVVDAKGLGVALETRL